MTLEMQTERKPRKWKYRTDFTKSSRIYLGDAVLYSPPGVEPRAMVCAAPPANIGYEAIWLEGILGPVRLEYVKKLRTDIGRKHRKRRTPGEPCGVSPGVSGATPETQEPAGGVPFGPQAVRE